MISSEPKAAPARARKKSGGAQTEVIDWKNTEELKTLSASFHDEFTPATVYERFLVDTLVHAEWRQRQCVRLEAAVWKAHRILGGTDTENSTAAIFFRALKDLDRVGRAEETYNKMFHSTLKRLLAIQRERAKTTASTAGKPSSGLFLVPKRPKNPSGNNPPPLYETLVGPGLLPGVPGNTSIGSACDTMTFGACSCSSRFSRGLSDATVDKLRPVPAAPARSAALRTAISAAARFPIRGLSHFSNVGTGRRKLQLRDLYAVALYYSPELDVARAHLRTAKAAIVTASTRPNPSLSIGGGYTNAPESPVVFYFTPSLLLETGGKRGLRTRSRASLPKPRASMWTPRPGAS